MLSPSLDVYTVWLVFLQNNYEEEVDCYERHLEMVYGLCSTCEYNVKYELQKQNQILSEKLDLTPVRAAKLDNTEEVGVCITCRQK